MQMIYNSDNYYVVEFGAEMQDGVQYAGGYEIVGKHLKREIFLGGKLAEHFREDVRRLIESEPTEEEVDDFLGRFDTVMLQPVVVH